MLYYYRYGFDTPFGDIAIAADDYEIRGIWFSERSQAPVDLNMAQYAATGLITAAADWLRAYFAGKRPDLSGRPPLAAPTTPFRREVLSIAETVPYGEVISYGEIAKEIARRHGIEKMSAQAVGGAMKSNRVLIMIPCHRVIAAKGALGGYGGNVDIKRFLLAHERG